MPTFTICFYIPKALSGKMNDHLKTVYITGVDRIAERTKIKYIQGTDKYAKTNRTNKARHTYDANNHI